MSSARRSRLSSRNASQAIEDEIRSRSDLSEKSKRSHMTNQQQEMIERITNEAAF
jgi:hypothetical protein